MVIRDFQFVADQLDEKIRQICAEVWGTEPPLLFLTNDRRLHKKVNKQLKKEGKEELAYSPNFREKIAKEKVYKGQRVQEKPFHFDNITAYMFANYEVKVAVGMEADDLLSVYQCERIKQGFYDTIICSRDKDLRITPGMHYGWECGKQRAFGPARVDDIGSLELVKTASGNKLIGTGLKFFYSQVLTGDGTDNYGGLQGCGPVAAHKSLHDCTSEAELFERVARLYEGKLGEGWRELMLEQAQLAWMVRELGDDGLPVMYKMYDERVKDAS